MTDGWSLEPASVVDPIGRVVRSEGRVGRAISRRYIEETKNLLALAEQRRWFDAGLVHTKTSSEGFKDFELVLEHERVPFVTQRGEWSAIGLQRAALCVLTLSLRLLDDGFFVQDPHSWNVLFDATTPRFVDFTSVRPVSEVNSQAWFDQFKHYFLAPLLLFEEGKDGLARQLTHERMNGVGLWTLQNCAPSIVQLPDFTEYGREALERLVHLIEGLRFAHAGGEWHDYAQPREQQDFRSKDNQVFEILNRLNFASAIDIGANKGLHAFMCANLGAKAIACDIEEGCVNDLFIAAEARSADILPLVLDIVNFPGTNGAFNTQPAANERLRCDLVIALALVHHVSFRRRFYPDVLLNGIVSFTRESALIEFVPDDDWHVAQWGLPPLDNYSFDGFQTILRQHFHDVEYVPIDPAPRGLFVCQRKIAPEGPLANALHMPG